MKIKYQWMLAIVFAFATTHAALADPTALELVKKADNYVGIQSKDKVLRIYSEKSAASLEPNIWHVVLFNPDTTFKSTDVKFGAGQEMEVTHPFAPIWSEPKDSDILDLSKITVDSPRALRIAASQPLLKGLDLRFSKMTLSRSDYGVIWKVELWSAKIATPGETVDVGTVSISATDGSVVHMDLHPGRAG